MPHQLTALPFVDMILGPNFCDLKDLSDNGSNLPVPDKYSDDVQALRTLCDAEHESKGDELTVVFQGVKFRVTTMHDEDSYVRFVTRIGANVRALTDLPVSKAVIDAATHRDLRGLVVVIGGFGVGKTTTAGSLFAAWVDQYGGLGLALEDPTELAMTGPTPSGRGRIVQVPVSEASGGYQAATQRGLRSRANAFYIGEIRNGITAVEVLYIAANDRPIFATLHAESIEQALMKLQAWCATKDTTTQALNSLLAESVSVILHLSVDPHGSIDPSVKRLIPRALIIPRGVDGNSTRAKIREGKFAGLADNIVGQASHAMYGGQGRWPQTKATS